jgi:hypothetical protein
MKRIAIAFTLLFLVIALFAPISEATRTKKKKATSVGKKVAIPCPEPLNNIEDCLDTGCGPSLDPNLNRQKNIRSFDGEAEPMTIQQMRNLPDPVRSFVGL